MRNTDMNARKDTVPPKVFIERRLAEGLVDLKRGRSHGPFSSAAALIRSLHHEAEQLKKR